jgi:hypothetical protein
MNARFELNARTARNPLKNVNLTLAGLDSNGEEKTLVRIMLNGRLVFEGPNPLPDDSSSPLLEPGSWGSHTWAVDPALLLQGANILTIINVVPGLEPMEVGERPFLIIDYVTISLE